MDTDTGSEVIFRGEGICPFLATLRKKFISENYLTNLVMLGIKVHLY